MNLGEAFSDYLSKLWLRLDEKPLLIREIMRQRGIVGAVPRCLILVGITGNSVSESFDEPVLWVQCARGWQVRHHKKGEAEDFSRVNL